MYRSPTPSISAASRVVMQILRRDVDDIPEEVQDAIPTTAADDRLRDSRDWMLEPSLENFRIPNLCQRRDIRLV
jgi:hypothetical protein